MVLVSQPIRALVRMVVKESFERPMREAGSSKLRTAKVRGDNLLEMSLTSNSRVADLNN